MQISDCLATLLMFFSVAFFVAAPIALSLTFTLSFRKVRFDS